MSSGSLFPSRTSGVQPRLPTSSIPSQQGSRTASITARPMVKLIDSPCTHSEVVVELSTKLVIQNYQVFYKATPIHTFQPMYRSLADGSLVSPPFEEDLFNANFSLLFLGSLAAVFIRNIFASAGYIRRGRVKRKTLFYLLLSSQLLAPVSLVPVIVSYFVEGINCTVVVMLSYMGAMVSLGILITGILGVKAYKCLENPRILPIILFLLQASTTAVVIADLVTTRGVRRLTGSCVQVTDLQYTRFFVGLQAVQSLFVCLCFVWASYKSRSSPAARGRVSLRLSTDDVQLEIPCLEDEDQQNSQRRGWWDYVPGNNNNNSTARNQKGPLKPVTSMLNRAAQATAQLFNGTTRYEEKIGSYTQTFQEARAQNITAVDPLSVRRGVEPHLASAEQQGRNSPALSSISRFSRLFPRMELFHQVLNDELLYTTFITFACLLVAILVAISVHLETCLSITVWITLNWAFISLLVVHSLGRVVARHEKEAWIQQSASRNGVIRGANHSVRQSRRTHTTQWTSSIIPSRNRSLHERYRRDPNDPYSETRPLDQERFSWQFGTVAPPSANPPPLLLSVRNVTHDSQYTQEFEFEPAPPQRTVSWRSNSTGRNGRLSAASAYSTNSNLEQQIRPEKPRPF